MIRARRFCPAPCSRVFSSHHVTPEQSRPGNPNESKLWHLTPTPTAPKNASSTLELTIRLPKGERAAS